MIKSIVLAMALIVGLNGAGLAASGEDIKTEELLKTTTSWDGSTLPPYPQGQPEVTLVKIEIPPGKQLPMHSHPVINAGILLKGKLMVETEDHKVIHLQAGDAIAEVVNKGHYGKNEGAETCEILVLYAGIKDQPITIAQ